jgi:hypothetical protein
MLRGPLRNEIRPRLEATFHDRLRRVLLFGSEARGEASASRSMRNDPAVSGRIRFFREEPESSRKIADLPRRFCPFPEAP